MAKRKQMYRGVVEFGGIEIIKTIKGTGVSNNDNFGKQLIAADATMHAAFGGFDIDNPAYGGPIMGHIAGDTLTSTSAILGGLIGKYNVKGAKSTKYPAGAVLGCIGEEVTTAAWVDGAFVAVLGGDKGVVKAGAAFKVKSYSSFAGSGFDYGMDLYDDPTAIDASNVAHVYNTADIRFASQGLFVSLTAAITANVTTTATAAGTLGKTTHATGRASLFVSDGSKWQFLTNA